MLPSNVSHHVYIHTDRQTDSRQTHIHIYMYMYVYMYIYIERESEKERERASVYFSTTMHVCCKEYHKDTVIALKLKRNVNHTKPAPSVNDALMPTTPSRFIWFSRSCHML